MFSGVPPGGGLLGLVDGDADGDADGEDDGDLDGEAEGEADGLRDADGDDDVLGTGSICAGNLDIHPLLLSRLTAAK